MLKKTRRAKPLQKAVKRATIAVRKHRKKKAEKTPWELTVDACCDVLRRTHEAMTDAQLNELKIEARAHGARPMSHIFDFSVGEQVHVLVEPKVWWLANIAFIRKCNLNNTIVPAYLRECGPPRNGEIIVLQIPSDKWCSMSNNGYLAVRDWQCIPLFAYDKPHKSILQSLAKKKATYPEAMSQESRTSIPLVPRQKAQGGYQRVKIRMHTEDDGSPISFTPTYRRKK